MFPRVSDRRLLAATLAALVGLAWLTLFLWTRSPYGRFLSHRENESVAGLGGSYTALAAVFVAGWTLMTVAMMLPTSLPLVALFHSLVRRRPRPGRLVAALVAGYLAVWTLFAAVAHLADLGIHKGVDGSAWLSGHAWAIGAGTVVLAGVYQFTPLKRRCLDKCRSPLSFVMSNWSGGGREGRQAFGLGLRHGVFCVGCCWSLMLLMFAVGVGNLGWMLALGTVLAIEKNVSWGRRLSAPLGAGLLGWGLAIAVAGAPGLGSS